MNEENNNYPMADFLPETRVKELILYGMVTQANQTAEQADTALTATLEMATTQQDIDIEIRDEGFALATQLFVNLEMNDDNLDEISDVMSALGLGFSLYIKEFYRDYYDMVIDGQVELLNQLNQLNKK